MFALECFGGSRLSSDLLNYPAWVNALEKWGLHRFAAVFLEASAPLNFVAAQAIYVGEPLLKGLLPGKQLRSIASMLEDSQATGEFIRQLRQID